MFARQVLRPARAIQVQTKRYASTSPSSSGGGSGIYILGALVLGGGGFFAYRQRNSPAWKDAKEQAKGAVDEAKTKAKSAMDEAKDKAKGAVESVKGGSDPSVAPAGSKAFTGGDQGFVSLVLDKVDTINHNTKQFRFKLPSEDDVSGLQIASALLAKYKGPEMEKPVLRPYTPTSDEDQKGYVDFIIKRYKDGPMSEHLHGMEPGQRLDFKGPLPKYPWAPNKHEHITLIAGGTGITPMYQLIRAVFNNPSDNTKVTLVFGNISEEDILLKRELEELENTYPRRFRAFYTLDNPKGTWSGTSGHITKELLKTVMPEPKEGDNIKVFVCGPPGLYKAVSGTKKSPKDQGELDGMLKELGYSKEQVYKF